MTYFTILHWLVSILITGLGVGLIIASIIKLRGQMQLVAILVIIILGSLSIFVSVLSLDKFTKKAYLYKFENKRDLRHETIVFSGYVVNNGDYTIGESEITIKFINNGKAIGQVRGTDFYQPNSFWTMIFGAQDDTGKKKRPNAIVFKQVVATNLPPGKRVRFRFTRAFPKYFRNILMREQLENH